MSWIARFAMTSMYPSGGALPGIAETDLDGFLAKFRAEAPPMFRAGLELSALAFTMTPIITIGVPLPAFLLPASLLDRHIDRLASHPLYLLRQAVLALKAICGLCWGADPGVREAMGLTPYPQDPGTWKGSSTAEVAR